MNQANQDRRDLMTHSAALVSLLSCGMWGKSHAQAIQTVGASAFEATTVEAALLSLGSVPQVSQAISLEIPDVVENGAFVPVTVSSSLANTQEISLVVDSNPYPFVMHFKLREGTDAFVSTRVKMAGSGRVYAMVLADGKLYACSKETNVTVGGCG
jgi:sulfur-oxidizing protein SoxY